MAAGLGSAQIIGGGSVEISADTAKLRADLAALPSLIGGSLKPIRVPITIDPKAAQAQLAIIGVGAKPVTIRTDLKVATVRADFAALIRSLQAAAKIDIQVTMNGAKVRGGGTGGTTVSIGTINNTYTGPVTQNMTGGGGAGGGGGKKGDGSGGGHGMMGGGMARHFGAFAIIRDVEQIVANEQAYHKAVAKAEGVDDLIKADVEHRTSYDSMAFGIGKIGRFIREMGPGEATADEIEQTQADAKRGEKHAAQMRQDIVESRRLRYGAEIAATPEANDKARLKLEAEGQGARDKINERREVEHKRIDDEAAVKAAQYDPFKGMTSNDVIAHMRADGFQGSFDDYRTNLKDKERDSIASAAKAKVDPRFKADEAQQAKQEAADKATLDREEQSRKAAYDERQVQYAISGEAARLHQRGTAALRAGTGGEDTAATDDREAQRLQLMEKQAHETAAQRDRERKEHGGVADPAERKHLEDSQESERKAFDEETLKDREDRERKAGLAVAKAAAEGGAATLRADHQTYRARLLEFNANADARIEAARNKTKQEQDAVRAAIDQERQAMGTEEAERISDSVATSQAKGSAAQLSAGGRGFAASILEYATSERQRIDKMAPGSAEKAAAEAAFQRTTAARIAARKQDLSVKKGDLAGEADEADLRVKNLGNLASTDAKIRQIQDAVVTADPALFAAQKNLGLHQLDEMMSDTVGFHGGGEAVRFGKHQYAGETPHRAAERERQRKDIEDAKKRLEGQQPTALQQMANDLLGQINDKMAQLLGKPGSVALD